MLVFMHTSLFIQPEVMLEAIFSSEKICYIIPVCRDDVTQRGMSMTAMAYRKQLYEIVPVVLLSFNLAVRRKEYVDIVIFSLSRNNKAEEEHCSKCCAYLKFQLKITLLYNTPYFDCPLQFMLIILS